MNYYPRQLERDPEKVVKFLTENYHLLSMGGSQYMGLDGNLPSSKDYEKPIKVLIVVLSPQKVKAVSSTHVILNRLINYEEKDVFGDLCFLPPKDDWEIFEEHQINPFFGSVSKHPPQDFDFVFFSTAVVYEKFHLIHAMNWAGVPFSKHERMKDTKQPIIILGGAAAPIMEDIYGKFGDDQGCLVDATLIGEGEVSIPALLEVARKFQGYAGPLKENKESFLKICHVSHVPGFYEPDKYLIKYSDEKKGIISEVSALDSIYELPIHKAEMDDLDNYPNFYPHILHINGDNLGTVDMRVSEGCSGAGCCSFCIEGSIARGYKENSLGKLEKDMHYARIYSGASTVCYYSFNTTYHSRYMDLLKLGYSIFSDINFITQKADMIAARNLIDLQKACGGSRTSSAVEGSSERLRNYLNKNLSLDQLKKLAEQCFKNKYTELKLYYIITGYENEEDAEEFREFFEWCYRKKKEYGVNTNLRVSYCPLIISTYTVLRYEPCRTSIGKDSNTLKHIVKVCKEMGIGFRTAVKRNAIRMDQLINILDRRATKAYLPFVMQTGFLFYYGIRDEHGKAFEEAVIQAGIDIDAIFAAKPYDYVFSTDHLKLAMDKEFLIKSHKKAVQFISTRYCLRTEANLNPKCHGCKSCRTPEKIKLMTQRPVEGEDPDSLKPSDFLKIRESIKSVQKWAFKVMVDNEWLRVASKHYYQVSVASAMMRVNPKLELDYYDSSSTSRDPFERADQEDWTYGCVYLDITFRHEVQFPEKKDEFIAGMNQYLNGLRVLDMWPTSMDWNAKRLDSFVLYYAKVGGSLLKSRNAYLRLKTQPHFTLKYRQAKGKGTYQTLEREISKEDLKIFTGGVGQDGKFHLWFSLKENVDPNMFMGFLFTGELRKAQIKSIPLKCLLHYRQPVTQETGLCQSCGHPIETLPENNLAVHKQVCIECLVGIMMNRMKVQED